MVTAVFTVIGFDRITVAQKWFYFCVIVHFTFILGAKLLASNVDGIKQLVTFNILANYTDAPITQVKF